MTPGAPELFNLSLLQHPKVSQGYLMPELKLRLPLTLDLNARQRWGIERKFSQGTETKAPTKGQRNPLVGIQHHDLM